MCSMVNLKQLVNLSERLIKGIIHPVPGLSTLPRWDTFQGSL